MLTQRPRPTHLDAHRVIAFMQCEHVRTQSRSGGQRQRIPVGPHAESHARTGNEISAVTIGSDAANPDAAIPVARSSHDLGAKPGDLGGMHLPINPQADRRRAARTERRTHPRTALGRARIAEMAAHIDKPTFTRADMVELIGAQLPIDIPGEPCALIEQIVDEVGIRISAPREAHHREGNEKFTIDAIIAEEERIFEMVDESDNRARLDLRRHDVDDLSADQQRAIHNIAVSPYLVQPLQAPAGAGKTHSLKALRAAAHRARKDVLVSRRPARPSTKR